MTMTPHQSESLTGTTGALPSPPLTSSALLRSWLHAHGLTKPLPTSPRSSYEGYAVTAVSAYVVPRTAEQGCCDGSHGDLPALLGRLHFGVFGSCCEASPSTG